MGIKGLNKLINSYSPNASSTINISQLCGSKIAIDGEILIHKFKSTNSNNSHIFGFLSNALMYLKHGIIPVYVFDGIPNSSKRNNVIVKRQNKKDQIQQKIQYLEEMILEKMDSNISDPDVENVVEELLKFQKKMSCMTVSKTNRAECKYLLKLLGIPFVKAEEDAEALCVSLQRSGVVDYVHTEDTDAIPYYVAKLIKFGSSWKDELIRSPMRVLKMAGKDNKEDFIITDVATILLDMEMTPESFVDMCILSGCDFCEHIPRIGPMRSHVMIKKHDNIENIMLSGEIPDTINFQYQSARDIFTKDYKNPKNDLELGNINIEELKKYLIDERSLEPEPIITKYYKSYNIFKTKIFVQSKNTQSSTNCDAIGFSSSVCINKNAGPDTTIGIGVLSGSIAYFE